MNPFVLPADARDMTLDEVRLLSRVISAVNSVEQRSGIRPTRALVAEDLWPKSIEPGSIRVGDLLVVRSRLVQPGSVVCIRDAEWVST